MAFAEWEAATAAGATLDELFKWETGSNQSGDYPKWFKAKVVAWHGLHTLVEAHRNDAAVERAKRKGSSSG